MGIDAEPRTQNTCGVFFLNFITFYYALVVTILTDFHPQTFCSVSAIAFGGQLKSVV